VVRIIAKRTLRQFWERSPRYRDAQGPLEAWYTEARHATWQTPADVKTQYHNASVFRDGRMVFNIAGNKYRLVVRIRYDTQTIFVRFVGTHADYDTIDAQMI
jgi:mRNA interferase HigB